MWLNDRELKEYWDSVRKQMDNNKDDDVFDSIALFIIVLVWILAVGRGISS